MSSVGREESKQETPAFKYIQIVLIQLDAIDIGLLNNIVHQTAIYKKPTEDKDTNHASLDYLLDENVYRLLQSIYLALLTAAKAITQLTGKPPAQDELTPLFINATLDTERTTADLQIQIYKSNKLCELCENVKALYPDTFFNSNPKDTDVLAFLLNQLSTIQSVFMKASSLKLEVEQKSVYENYTQQTNTFIIKALKNLSSLLEELKQNNLINVNHEKDIRVYINEASKIKNEEYSPFEDTTIRVTNFENAVDEMRKHLARIQREKELKARFDGLINTNQLLQKLIGDFDRNTKEFANIVPPPKPKIPITFEEKTSPTKLTELMRVQPIVDEYLQYLWGKIRKKEGHLPLHPPSLDTLEKMNIRDKTKERERYKKFLIVAQLKNELKHNTTSLEKRLDHFMGLLTAKADQLIAHRKKGSQFFQSSHGFTFVKKIDPSLVAKVKEPAAKQLSNKVKSTLIKR